MSERVHLTIECDEPGCGRSTLATARLDIPAFRGGEPYYRDVRFPPDVNGKETGWSYEKHTARCPEHAPTESP